MLKVHVLHMGIYLNINITQVQGCITSQRHVLIPDISPRVTATLHRTPLAVTKHFTQRHTNLMLVPLLFIDRSLSSSSSSNSNNGIWKRNVYDLEEAQGTHRIRFFLYIYIKKFTMTVCGRTKLTLKTPPHKQIRFNVLIWKILV